MRWYVSVHRQLSAVIQRNALATHSFYRGRKGNSITSELKPAAQFRSAMDEPERDG